MQTEVMYDNNIVTKVLWRHSISMWTKKDQSLMVCLRKDALALS